MVRNNILKIDNGPKTKTWWIFLFVFLIVIIPFTMVWLLIGEFNILGMNLLIAKNTCVWHGIIKQDNIDFLAKKYQLFYQGGYETLKAQAFFFFFYYILLILVALILIAIFIPILFSKLKINGIDVFPFSCSFGFLMTGIILTGLMTNWQKNMMSLYWIIRILISLCIGIIFFLITNSIINKWLINSKHAISFLFGYKKQYELDKSVKQQLQNNIDIYQEPNKDKSYIDIGNNE